MWFRRAKKMWVATVDEDGKALGDGRWVDIPKADRFATDGFAQIENYVSRLRSSTASVATVMIAAPDQNIAFNLWQRRREPGLTFIINWRSEPEREVAIRQFFAEHGLAIAHDYLGGNGNISDAMRCLGCFLPPDVKSMTRHIGDALRQIYHLKGHEVLEFTFQEN